MNFVSQAIFREQTTINYYRYFCTNSDSWLYSPNTIRAKFTIKESLFLAILVIASRKFTKNSHIWLIYLATVGTCEPFSVGYHYSSCAKLGSVFFAAVCILLTWVSPNLLSIAHVERSNKPDMTLFSPFLPKVTFWKRKLIFGFFLEKGDR